MERNILKMGIVIRKFITVPDQDGLGVMVDGLHKAIATTIIVETR